MLDALLRRLRRRLRRPKAARVDIPDVVTAEWLRSLGACPEEAADFARAWPEGAAATRENLRRAVRDGFSVGWFAWRVLRPRHLAEYKARLDSSWRAYFKATLSALDGARAAGADPVATSREVWARFRGTYCRLRGEALADTLGLARDDPDERGL